MKDTATERDVFTLSREEERLLDIGKKVLTQEAQELINVSSRLGVEMIRAAKLVFDCKGRVVLSGLGKSGIIAKKIRCHLCIAGYAIDLPACYRRHSRRPGDGVSR